MTFNLKRNDTRPIIDYTLRDQSGAPVDLTGCSVFFIMAKYRNREVLVNKEASIVDSSQGQVSYMFASEDTEQIGIMVAEFKVLFPDGSTETFPSSGYILINIEEDLGSGPIQVVVIDGGTFLNPDDSTDYDGGVF